MKLSKKSIEALRIVINGDGSELVTSPYRPGWKIKELFNVELSEMEGMSRWKITEECLEKINDTAELDRLVQLVLNPADFFEQADGVDHVIEYLNRYFAIDGYEIKLIGHRILVSRTDEKVVDLEIGDLHRLGSDNLISWLGEHSQKVNDKIAAGDYSGSITNSRSLVEEFFVWVLNNTEGGYEKRLEGDLSGQAKEVIKRYEIEPKNIDGQLKQILSGMISVIHGLGSLRNVASDSHGTGYRPSRRHAVLAANSAHTIISYFIDLIIS